MEKINVSEFVVCFSFRFTMILQKYEVVFYTWIEKEDKFLYLKH